VEEDSGVGPLLQARKARPEDGEDREDLSKPEGGDDVGRVAEPHDPVHGGLETQQLEDAACHAEDEETGRHAVPRRLRLRRFVALHPWTSRMTSAIPGSARTTLGRPRMDTSR